MNYNNPGNSDNSRPDPSGTTRGLMLPAILFFCFLAVISLSLGSVPSHALHPPGQQAASSKQAPSASPKNVDTAVNVTISYPPVERLSTPYRQIFLEGKIEAQNGLRRIELNGQELFNGADLEALLQKNWPNFNRGNQSNQGLASQNQDPSKSKGMSKTQGPSTAHDSSKVQVLPKVQDLSKMRQTLMSSLGRYNLYYMNQIYSLREGHNSLDLVVEDNLGHRTAKRIDIHAIPPKESPGSPESQHRMLLALIPPAKRTDAGGNVVIPPVPKAGIAGTGDAVGATPAAGDRGADLSDYIYQRLSEAFSRQARFRLVERAKLPWLLIEKAIQTKDISQQEFARQIGHLTPAEGVIFAEVQKRDNGLEILGRLVDLESTTLVFHRVFAPVSEPQGHRAFEELNTIISGLAMKFRDSFPLLNGSVLAREGPIIQVDLGTEKGIFRGMCYNIWRDDGQELMCRAVVKEAAKGTSRARIIEEGKSREIRKGCRVSTR